MEFKRNKDEIIKTQLRIIRNQKKVIEDLENLFFDFKSKLQACCCSIKDGARIYRIPNKTLERYKLDFWNDIKLKRVEECLQGLTIS